MNEHPSNTLPADLTKALPLLQELPAPESLLRLLEDWQQEKDCEATDCRLRQKLLRWEKQRQHLAQTLPENPEQWEDFRRMLLSLLASPLVLLSALASHLTQLRQFKTLTANEQQQLALLTQSLYAPIANRLGLSTWKWEMEDIAFRLAKPDTYTNIAKALASKRSERETFISQTITHIQQYLQQEGLVCEVYGRPKHIYSIYKKMQHKSLSFEQLYDLHALRILTHSIEYCYRVLGILHQQYLPILREFDDYIARPKANGYQSIHTILLGARGWPIEVQIRTHSMHQRAEEGVAAHWRYKEGNEQDNALANLVSNLRNSLSGELDALSFEAWEKELEGLHIVALTPKGDLLRLTQGATVLDFAYNIHTDLGHACRGAIVNGKIKPLDEPLSNGDRVEILSQKNGLPSLKWLSGHFLATNRARNKVRNFFNRQHADAHFIEGKNQLDRLRSRFRLSSEFTPFLLERLKFDNEKSLAIRIGQGKINSEQLSRAVQEYLHPRIETPKTSDASTSSNTKAPEIFIPSIGKVSAQLAQCCSPQPPNAIIGLLTRNHGLRIHRQDCPDVLALSPNSQQRLIRVRWGNDTSPETQLCLDITAIERDNLLADLVTCLTKTGIRIGHFHTIATAYAKQTRIHLELSLAIDQDWLALMDKIEALDAVLDVKYCVEA